MDEKKILHRVQYLSHKLFVENKEGAEFVKLMRYLHVLTPTFPQKPEVLEAHGGALGWAGFCAGQVKLLHSIEVLAQTYRDKLEAELKQKEKFDEFS